MISCLMIMQVFFRKRIAVGCFFFSGIAKRISRFFFSAGISRILLATLYFLAIKYKGSAYSKP